MAEVRPLSSDDWQIIQAARLRSLRDAPHAFTSTFERESSFDEPTCRDRATTCQWFVATEGNEAVGIAGGVNGWRVIRPNASSSGCGWLRHTGAREWPCCTGWPGGPSPKARPRCVWGCSTMTMARGRHGTGETMAVHDDPTRTIEVMRVDL
jgi:hypothetical protein